MKHHSYTKPEKPKLLLLFVSGVSLLSGCIDQPPNTIVVLEPAIINLGSVEQNSEHAIKLRMHNNSDRNLKLREIHVTCGCMKPDSLVDAVIPSGGSLPIDIRYKPGSGKGKTIQRIIAELSFLDQPEQVFSRQCSIRADIIEEIRAIPNNIRERMVEYRDHQYEITLQSNNGREYVIDDILCTSSLLSASADRSVIDSNTETVITICAAGRNPLIRNISGKVVLQLKGGIIDRLTVPIELRRENSAEIFPDSIFLSLENQYSDELTLITSRPSHVRVDGTVTNLDVRIESESSNCIHTVAFKAKAYVGDDSHRHFAIELQLKDLGNDGDSAVIKVPIHINE